MIAEVAVVAEVFVQGRSSSEDVLEFDLLNGFLAEDNLIVVVIG